MLTLFQVALVLNLIEVFAGGEFLMLGLSLITPQSTILLAEFSSLHLLTTHGGEAACGIITLYGSAIFCMGVSGLVGLVSGEQKSTHGCVMYGGLHSLIAACCFKFKAMPGMYPEGLIFHAVLGALFWAALAFGKRAASAPGLMEEVSALAEKQEAAIKVQAMLRAKSVRDEANMRKRRSSVGTADL